MGAPISSPNPACFDALSKRAGFFVYKNVGSFLNPKAILRLDLKQTTIALSLNDPF